MSILLLCFLPSLAMANADVACVQILKRLENNEFGHVRGVYSYSRIWGSGFIDSLANLRDEHVWIDMGAGQARAQLEYVLHNFDVVDAMLLKTDYGILPWPEVSKRASTIAIGFKKPKISKVKNSRIAELYSNAEKSSVARFEYKEGRLFEDIPIEELPKTKLITDYYGVLSYSLKPDVVLRRYLELLQKDGEIYVFGLQRTKVEHQGQTVSFYDFLKDIDGLVVKPLEHDGQENLVSVKITVKNKLLRPQVPQLELKYIDDGTPPIREYDLKP